MIKPTPLSATRERRLAEIVLHAASLDTAARGTYLRRATAEDPELLALAERRLAAAADASHSFLAAPAGHLFETTRDPEASVAEPTTAELSRPAPSPEERYQRRALLGSGGMASVYRAYDTQLERLVALKLLDSTDAGTRHRFLREAQTQARLRHDHVLDVYETGELEGRPYIAMRCVEGKTILEARDEVSFEEMIRLLIQAAEGLHAAHREGLLHRDVKPSNILVEETPDGRKAWMADFGIAVMEDPGARTITADAAGTPHFMAPERLGETPTVDRRSDIYSFGATMYQLFSGELPFDSTLVVQVLRRIRDKEPAPLVEHAPDLPPEILAVVAKCMARDPARRYPSARAVAEDLRRYLEGDVVEAHTATLAYRLTRFALRHKIPLGLAAVATALLAAALVVAAWMGVEAVRANERAEGRRDQAEILITFMLGDLRRKLTPLTRLEVLDGIGEKALEYFAAIPEAELDDDDLARRSRALYQIGDVRIRQGRLAAAVPPLEESLRLARALADRDPANTGRLFELGQSYFWVGYVAWKQGDLAAALPPFQEYLAVSQRLLELDGENPDFRLELSYAHSNLGSLAQERGDLEEARRRFAAVLEITTELAARHPSETSLQAERASSYNTLAEVSAALGRFRESGELFKNELAIRRTLAAADPDSVTWRDYLGTSYDYVGTFEFCCGDRRLADEHFARSESIFRNLVAHDPEDGNWQFKLALAKNKLGLVMLTSSRIDEALEAWDEQRRILQTLVDRGGKNPTWVIHLAVSHYYLSQGLALFSDLPGARVSAEKALAILASPEAAVGRDQKIRIWTARSHTLNGLLREAAGELGGARESLDLAVGTFEPALAAGLSARDRIYLNQARFYQLGLGDSRPLASKIMDAYRKLDFWLRWPEPNQGESDVHRDHNDSRR